MATCDSGNRNQHQEALLNSLRWLQTSHEYTDLKIFCQDEVFQVHKAILCPRSKYFATACRWGKDGTSSKEEIELKDEDTKLVGLMLDYLYQLDYDDLLPNKACVQPSEEDLSGPAATVSSRTLAWESFGSRDNLASTENLAAESALAPVVALPDDDEWAVPVSKPRKDKKKRKSTKLRLKPSSDALDTERLVVNTLMYALADKYDLEDLKTLAKEKAASAMLLDWQSQAFVRATELAFETTPSSDRGLRDVFASTINKHRELVDYEEVQKLLDSGNGVAWALLRVVLKDARKDELGF